MCPELALATKAVSANMLAFKLGYEFPDAMVICKTSEISYKGRRKLAYYNVRETKRERFKEVDKEIGVRGS